MILSSFVRSAPPLLTPLFRSEGQAKILAALFLSGDDEVSITDLAERSGVAYGSVHREVGRLVEAGLLVQRRVGRSRLVGPDEGSALAGPVRALLLVSAGPVPLLAAELEGIPRVAFAFLFGSFAARMVGVSGEAPNDIDLMVVGAAEPMRVYEACRRVGDVVGRPVNPVILTRAEWESAAEDRSAFVSRVMDSPRIPVWGVQP